MLMSFLVHHMKRDSFPFIGEAALGSTYLLTKSWRMSSESLKSDYLLSLACLCTLPKVSFKSSFHQTTRFTSTSHQEYQGGPTYTRSAW